MIFKYINSAGTSMDLYCDSVKSSGTVHGRKWVPSTTDYTVGSKVDYWTKSAREIELTLIARGRKSERLALLDKLHDLFEYDIANNTPGTLYYNDWYCNCFITSADYSAGDLPTWIEQKINVYIPSATWYREATFTINAQSESESDVVYPVTYPFTYPLSGRIAQITNDGFTDCDFQIKAYGPATSVDIDIAGNTYKVDYAIESGQHLVIDSRDNLEADKRCYLVKSDGSTVNLYNYRDSSQSLFTKIKPGISEVSYNRNYGVDITLFKGRSEPKWNQ